MKLLRYGREIERLGQRYLLEAPLGSGGMADVCLAWDEQEQRAVAIKIIKQDELDQRSLDRFLREAAQIARWQHPNILRIYSDLKLELLDSKQGAIIPYIVMEYAQGGDLHKRLTPGTPYPLAETLHIFAQLCSAVAYAHQQGIIHRDLKPLNILFRVLPDGTEQIVLSDFGIAVEIDASHHTFARGGTLPYMAPEQLQGRAEAASDIFALGVILYQLCTGKLPFRRGLQDLLPDAPASVPAPPSSIVSGLPPALDDVILTALAHEPAQRYANATLLWEGVRAAIPRRSSTGPASRSPRSTSTASGQSSTEVRRPPAGRPLGKAGRPQEGQGRPQGIAPTIHGGVSSAETGIYAKQHEGLSSDPDEPIVYSRGDPLWSPGPIQRSPGLTRQLPIFPLSSDPDELVAYADPPRAPSTDPRSRSGTSRSPSYQNTPSRPPLTDPHEQSVSGRGDPRGRPDPRDRPKTPRGGPRTPVPALLRGARRTRSRVLIAVVALLIIAGILIYANPGSPAVPILKGALPGTAPATITITPSSKTIADTYMLRGVAGVAPDPAQRQIAARMISSPTASVAKTATPTGHNQVAAVQAKGQLTFFNGSFTKPFTVTAGTSVFGADGVPVVTDAQVVIPAANPATQKDGTATVAAHAISAGLRGNIVSLDINAVCCINDNSVFVKNVDGFLGGQDAITYAFLQQGDIDGVVNGVKGQLTQQAQAALQAQVLANEQLAGASDCPVHTLQDVPVGDHGLNVGVVNVTISVTCSAQAYDQKGLQSLVTGLLKNKANTAAGPGFALMGNVVMKTTVQGVSQGAVDLNVTASGLWVYQFNDAQKRNLTQQIVGKRVTDVKELLKNQAGVGAVSVQVNGDMLPRDPTQISVVVQNVPGLQG